MQKFWKFLKANVPWCIMGTAIYWGIPHLVVTLLGALINNWYFTLYAGVFAVQVALPAIPIIIGLSLAIKGLFLLFKKKKQKK